MVDSPEMPTTDNSYSDPVYDRLEMASNWLGRKWRFMVLLFAIVIVITMVSSRIINNTPDAESARKYKSAGSDKEKLEALIADDDCIAYYKAMAHQSLAKNLSGDNKLQEAIVELDKAIVVAINEPGLLPALKLSKAALLEDNKKIEEAISLYRKVISENKDNQAFVLPSKVSIAELTLIKAKGLEAGVAKELKKEAFDLLSALKDHEARGSEEIIKKASFLYYQLKNENPDFVE